MTTPIDTSLDDAELRALLDLFMCADPYPVHVHHANGGSGYEIDVKGNNHIQDFLDRVSQARGFAGWIDAYHYFQRPTPTTNPLTRSTP